MTNSPNTNLTAMAGEAGPSDLDGHIYQRLLKERIVFLGSEVKDANSNAICAQMLLLNAEDPQSAGTPGKRYALPHARIMMH